jgi:CPA2 family monovalent cation:H+ antiporter-2
LPFDRVSVIGSDEQLVRARTKLEVDIPPTDQAGDRPFGLASLVLPQGARFAGNSIRDCGLREEVDGLIVGVERGNERTLNPDSSVILQEGDRLWIVGDTGKINSLREAFRTPHT